MEAFKQFFSSGILECIFIMDNVKLHKANKVQAMLQEKIVTFTKLHVHFGFKQDKNAVIFTMVTQMIYTLDLISVQNSYPDHFGTDISGRSSSFKFGSSFHLSVDELSYSTDIRTDPQNEHGDVMELLVDYLLAEFELM
ncbi:hypothetical protein RF11_06170 [Thelohanellus kitauei]|uniref:Uncharacterized protein n=1 Tax=Thelohanellus kitauei TaxID=669202 RepID=A0A0C2M9I6_THEKT|nr:hypothetical protein RF11_06170 [Thelohanellus kitauei]